MSGLTEREPFSERTLMVHYCTTYIQMHRVSWVREAPSEMKLKGQQEKNSARRVSAA